MKTDNPVTSTQQVKEIRPFIPSSLTPLYYSSIAQSLTEKQTVRYNQLFGLYINELVILFETKYARAYAPLLNNQLLSPDLKDEIREFLADEDRHWRMFARFNREAAPELYKDRLFYFVGVPWLASKLAELFMRIPDKFLFVLLLVYIQEDRVQFISNQILRSADLLDPRYVAIHQKHSEDEAQHVDFGGRVLTLLWDRMRSPLRKVNVTLLYSCLKEFFTLPKRSGMRLLDRFIEEFPELLPQKENLRRELYDAVNNTKFYDTLYSREALPGCLNFFSRYREFDCLNDVFCGSLKEHSR